MAGSRNLNGGPARAVYQSRVCRLPMVRVIFQPVDYMAFIDKNQRKKRTHVVTGDSGNGLTHGVLSSHLIADEIEGIYNPWASCTTPAGCRALPKPCQPCCSMTCRFKPSTSANFNRISKTWRIFILALALCSVTNRRPGCTRFIRTGTGGIINVARCVLICAG